ECWGRGGELPPAWVRIISAVRTDADRKAFTLGLARRTRDARSPLPWQRDCACGAVSSRAMPKPPARRFAKSADDQRRVLALAFTHAARLHPVVGAVEQCHVVIIDVLVAHERPQQFRRLQGALGVG